MSKGAIRTLVTGSMLPQVEVALYHSEDKLRRDLHKWKIEIGELQDATAQTFKQRVDGVDIHFVLFNKTDMELHDQLALLAHEAVHIAENHLEWLGEEEPGSEEWAYVVQAVSGCLFAMHLEWLDKRKKHGHH